MDSFLFKYQYIIRSFETFQPCYFIDYLIVISYFIEIIVDYFNHFNIIYYFNHFDIINYFNHFNIIGFLNHFINIGYLEHFDIIRCL